MLLRKILTVRCSGQPNVQGFLAELKTKKKFPDSWRAFYGDCSGFIFLVLERWSEWNRSGWWNSNWFNATKTNQHWQMGIIDSRRYTSGQVIIFQLVFFNLYRLVSNSIPWKISIFQDYPKNQNFRKFLYGKIFVRKIFVWPIQYVVVRNRKWTQTIVQDS